MPLDPFHNMAVPKELATEFFATFARCEYAMKEAGYRRNDHGNVAAAWRRLSDEAVGWLIVTKGTELAEAIEFLTTAVPKVQTYTDGWQPLALRGDNLIAQALDAATRVRNNLFHGGKNGRVEQEPGRDERLVRASLTVLVALIEEGPGDFSISTASRSMQAASVAPYS